MERFQIRDSFSRKFAGKSVSEGIEKLYVELTANELRAKTGEPTSQQLAVVGENPESGDLD